MYPKDFCKPETRPQGPKILDLKIPLTDSGCVKMWVAPNGMLRAALRNPFLHLPPSCNEAGPPRSERNEDILKAFKQRMGNITKSQGEYTQLIQPTISSICWQHLLEQIPSKDWCCILQLLGWKPSWTTKVVPSTTLIYVVPSHPTMLPERHMHNIGYSGRNWRVIFHGKFQIARSSTGG